MADEIDDLLRRAMADLDAQVPEGYFDTLADRAMARLAATEPRDLGELGGVGVVSDASDLGVAGHIAGLASTQDDGARADGDRPGGPAATTAVAVEPARRRGAGRTSLGARVAPRLRAAAWLGGALAIAAVITIAWSRRAGEGTVAGQLSAPGSTRADRAPAAPVPTSGSAGGSAGADDVDRALRDGARLGRLGSGAASSRGPGALDPELVRRTMAPAAAAVRACYAGVEGQAVVRAQVAPSGELQRIEVTGPFAGTPVGACVERAVRALRFPPSRGSPHAVEYRYWVLE